MERAHPNQPVEPASDYVTTTSGTRGRYYKAADGSTWFCEEDGNMHTWKKLDVKEGK